MFSASLVPGGGERAVAGEGFPESKVWEMNLDNREGDAGKGDVAETTVSEAPNQGLYPHP